MPRSPKPPAAIWPAPDGADDHQVLILALGEQLAWVRWHCGKRWRLGLVTCETLRHLQAYWSMTGLSVTLDATRVP